MTADEAVERIVERIRHVADTVDGRDVSRTAVTLNKIAAVIEGEFGALAGEHTPYRRGAADPVAALRAATSDEEAVAVVEAEGRRQRAQGDPGST